MTRINAWATGSVAALFVAAAAAVAGCGAAGAEEPEAKAIDISGIRTGSELGKFIGKKIEAVGQAIDHKNGAHLHGEGFVFAIEGLSSWPQGFYSGGDKGKTVRVSGILAEAHDLPVFVPKKGEDPVQGIPVPEGTDLKKASHRYLIKNARWELIQDSDSVVRTGMPFKKAAAILAAHGAKDVTETAALAMAPRDVAGKQARMWFYRTRQSASAYLIIVGRRPADRQDEDFTTEELTMYEPGEGPRALRDDKATRMQGFDARTGKAVEAVKGE